ncbi:MAG: hypothetical protein KGP12_08405 [Actinomycetales bacterium]|nr:hypothetical protein [Actinomycetales bacterium]
MSSAPAEGDVPWWSSAGRPGAAGPEDSARSTPGVLLADLVTGVQAAVDWARRSVLDPHVSHADSSAHPQCLVCRANEALAQGLRPSAEPTGARIDWIELDPPAP